MNKEILIKYLNNSCIKTELSDFFIWLNSGHSDEILMDVSRSEWLAFSEYTTESGFERNKIILDKIHHSINIRNNKKLYNRKTVKPGSKTLFYIVNAAAILFIPLLAAFLFIQLHTNHKGGSSAGLKVDSLEIISPKGSQMVVYLADGSSVYLNHDSKLKYPQRFKGKVREVQLTGEGYFRIAQNTKAPFIVNSGDLNIIASGTEFNVQAYPENEVIETTLVDGEAIVEKELENGSTELLGNLLPGQHLSYNAKTSQLVNLTGNTERFTSWKERKLIFYNDSISQVTNSLSRWYNVDFIFEDENVKYLTYSATFNDESLYQILDLMKKCKPIDYKVLRREKLNDGSYSKQQIVILAKI